MNYPKKCVDCSKGEYIIKIVNYPTKGIKVPDIEILECNHCKEILIPAKSSKKISNYIKNILDNH